MCGIVGIVSLEKKALLTDNLVAMLDSIAHRGPDDAGYLFFHTGLHHATKVSFFQAFSDERFRHLSPLLPTIQSQAGQKEMQSHDWDIFLGHRRLSVIDITSAGHQPMSDLSKNIWLSYNGEIYNFKEIREELRKAGYKFYSQSDSEVIVYAYIHWGIECVKKFNGMFAFALYDNFQKKFFLVRDRYGIKPLYYCRDSYGNLIFASENKAIITYNERLRKLDHQALLEYFTFQNIFTNKTLFQDIKILESGHYLEVDLASKSITKRQYWDFCFRDSLRVKNERECQEELKRLFVRAVKRQMVSDVPLGGYLSGGIDSSSICGVASSVVRDLNTFTVGFDLTSAEGIELGFDERGVSEFLSHLFKTEHYEMILKSGDMERCLRNFSYHLEEPRAGQSYPNYYVAKLASKFVKVVLSGCGGDELFGGYPWRYYSAMDSCNFDEYVDKYYLFWQRLVPNRQLKELFAPIAKEIDGVWTRDIFENILKGNRLEVKTREDCINNSFYFESKTFLHGLLVVEDKLSMAHSLETRVPFLDNDLVDFAQGIPVNLKLNLSQDITFDENNIAQKHKIYRDNNGKIIFRKMLEEFIPKEIANAKKQGFSSPDSSWFKGESIEFVKSIILNKDSKIYRYFDYNTCISLVKEHLEGKKNRRLFIWSLLNFNEWCNLNLGGE